METATETKKTAQAEATEHKQQTRLRRTRPDQTTKVHNTRKNFKTLQRVATDKENLTGRQMVLTSMIKFKDTKTETTTATETDQRDKQQSSKSVQTGADPKVTEEDLTSDAGPSENYWQIVAERRRIALEETLIENKDLHEKIKLLINENEMLKQMVDESKSLVDVLQDIVSEQESGIDLGDTSTSFNEGDTSNV